MTKIHLSIKPLIKARKKKKRKSALVLLLTMRESFQTHCIIISDTN